MEQHVEGHVVGINDEHAVSINDWIPRARVVEDKVDLLEREEGEIGKLYGDTLQSLYSQICFFITFCTCTVVLFVKKVAAIWMLGFVLGVVFCYIVGVVLPSLSAYRQFSGLKITFQKLIERRRRLAEICSSLLEEYHGIAVREASIRKTDLSE